uniref:Uncharacterized protein n=1 Tax=Timema douglasi TaxID=61478 RepID=A0A7R8VUQ6_TIMDO|nr:unnamed protein product [Timema douglasi]
MMTTTTTSTCVGCCSHHQKLSQQEGMAMEDHLSMDTACLTLAFLLQTLHALLYRSPGVTTRMSSETIPELTETVVAAFDKYALDRSATEAGLKQVSNIHTHCSSSMTSRNLNLSQYGALFAGRHLLFPLFIAF